MEGQLCGLGRGKEGEAAERANVDCYCKEGRGTHRSWKGTQEWQKPFVFLMSESGACGLATVCVHHTPELLKRKMRGLDEKTRGLLPTLILLFHNFEILSQWSQMEYFTQ